MLARVRDGRGGRFRRAQRLESPMLLGQCHPYDLADCYSELLQFTR